MSTERRAILAAALLGLGACGGAEPAGPARVKLVDAMEAELLELEVGVPGPVVFAHDFDEGLGDWSVVTNPAAPLDREDELLEATIVDSEVGLVLRLEGRRGALYQVVPVEPLTTYEFIGSVRARELVPASEPFYGAAPWLAELTEYGPAEEIFAHGIDPLVYVRHLFPTAHGTAGWQDCRVVFRTGPQTRGLALALFLGLTEDVASGAAEFGPLQLRRLTAAETWYHHLRRPLLEYAAGEPALVGWRARRLVSAALGAEWRPSILSFPGDVLRMRVRVPGGEPVLETGLGPWSQSLLEGGGRAQRFSVRIEGEEVLGLDHAAAPTLTTARWRDVTIDLERFAGREVTLELSIAGDLPGVFGAPTLRNTQAGATEAWNLVLISIDTLRADHVGSYGYERETTPRLDRFASQGLRYADVTAQAPYTLPSHASMLTGQFPVIHGVQMPPRMLSARRSPSLPRILSARGYRTQAFTGGGFVNPDFGFDRGFDAFSNIDTLRHRDASFFKKMLEGHHSAINRMKRGGVIPFQITQQLIDEHGPERVSGWIREHRDEPFFLFLHTYTVHDYDPPAEYRRCRQEGCTSELADFTELRLTRATGWTPMEISAVDREHLVHLYDEALRFTDHLVGELLEQLDELGLSERTIVAITSDHGEEMFDRGFFQHGKTLYEELTAIPLLLRYPGVEPGVVGRPVMLIDLAPTLLGLLGLPPDARMQGVDLLHTAPTSRPIWSEVDDAFVHKYAFRDSEGIKLLYGSDEERLIFPAPKEWELFDLGQDPDERRDLSATDVERLARMRSSFEQHLSRLRALAKTLGEVGLSELDDETLNQLRELGYVD